jgi:23S rRNA (cytidine2498-2'-O)-methyltransferase
LKLEFDPRFLFTVCQVGAEPVLKRELAREYPDLRFAYSRPGFVTFKHISTSESLVDFQLQSVFARAYGASLEKIQLTQIDRVLEIAEQLKDHYHLDKPIHLHVWERDFYPPGEEALGFVSGVLASQFEQKIRNAGPSVFLERALPDEGDWVLDLVVLESDEAWVGYHRHSSSHSSWPGGRIPISLPDAAPSRAYLKLEEAITWAKAPIYPGDIAVEVGSAPGGASYALLQRGVKVVGVDPAEMDPIVLSSPNFIHLKQPIDTVRRKDLPDSIQWILLDMNVQPRVSLSSIERMLKPGVVGSLGPILGSLLGVILTVKLNEWKLADQIPHFVERVRRMGMTRVKAVQLASHRQEVLIFGLTRKGATRKK